MLKTALRIALLLISLNTVIGFAANEGPFPGCFPCDDIYSAR